MEFRPLVIKILPLSDVNLRLSELISGVAERRDEIVVTRHGKPAAVIVNYAEYKSLKETLDVLSDENLMKQIRASERYFARGGKGFTFEQVFGEPLAPAKQRFKK